MSFSFSIRNKRIINLVFNDHSIRFVELKQANPPTALKWGERYLPPGIINGGKIIDFETLTNILDELIDDWKIHRRPVRFLVPDPHVIIRKVSVPADIQEDEIKNYLYLELGFSIHLPFENPVFDIYQLPSKAQNKEILLFASPEKYVMEFADILAGLKLNPIAADISPLAIYRLYYQLNQANRDEHLFTVQFDLTSVSMCIFENQVPHYMRNFPIDFDMEKWDIKQDSSGLHEYVYNGEVSELMYQFEDINKEITKLMDFYRYSLHNGKKELTKILLNGDHPLLQLILKEMKVRFDIPVELLRAEPNSTSKNKMVPAAHLLALCLALKEVQ